MQKPLSCPLHGVDPEADKGLSGASEEIAIRLQRKILKSGKAL